MNLIVPFKSNVKFDTNISSIASISLEHEVTINDSNLLGNFLITGEYKMFEVSVNTEHFKFTLPFNVDLPVNINRDTVNFEIDDFTYELCDNTLNVNIMFKIMGDEMEEVIQEDRVQEPDIKEEIPEANYFEENEITTNEPREVVEEKIDAPSDDVLSNFTFIDNSLNNYITYHIHFVEDSDTVESICQKYNISYDKLHEYNDFKELSKDLKLIIPLDE